MPAGFEGWKPKSGRTNLVFEAKSKTRRMNLTFEAKSFFPMFFFWRRLTGVFRL